MLIYTVIITIYTQQGVNMDRVGNISEHLIVDSLKSTTLNLHSCGYHTTSHYNNKISRPNGRKDYQLFYIINGSGKFTINNKEIIASSGSVIIYPPNTSQLYHFLVEENTCYYSLNFIGANNHLELTPIFEVSPTPFIIGYNQTICNTLEAIIDELIRKEDHYLQVCNYYLYTILLMILRHHGQSTKVRYAYEPAIQKTAHYMRSTYAKKYTLQHYANYANLSISRFINDFKSIFSISPMKFLTKIRMENACWLLMNTQMSINDIAHFVGYEDSLYFSRIFRKEHNMSPSEYRKNCFPE